MEKYRQQLRHIDEICIEFEKESSKETDEEKKLKFERILDLMQQVSEFV